MLENVETGAPGACGGKSMVEHGIRTPRITQNDVAIVPNAQDLLLGDGRHE